MKTEQRWWSSTLTYILLILLVVITLIPILYTISASFKTNAEIMQGGPNLIPKKFTFDNFVTAWTSGSKIGGRRVTFANYTLNSIILSVLTTVGTVFFTSMSSYCFQRGNFPGRSIIMKIFLGTMFVAAGSVTIFPIVQLAAKMKLNNLYGAAIVQIFTTSASNLFLSMGYLRTISPQIDEAAKIDGCSFFGIYRRIILPLSTPILATIALMSFSSSWNAYLLPMVFTLGNTKQQPLVVAIVALKNFGGEGASQYNLLMAGTVLAIAPMIIIYLAMNRYFVAGITSGAIKG
ncbi:MAG: carbohydrate ABC transporter permease [Candidatus Cloacimonetes bacterium]|nr:carbohydrate ABC transporter permease [Candidatus Cloacimonadota bacterium]